MILVNKGKDVQVVIGQATTGISGVLEISNSSSNNLTVQACIDGTGAVTATINVECSIDGIHFTKYPATSISLTGTTSTSAFANLTMPVKFVRFNTTDITGTGAKLSVFVAS